MIMLFWDDKNYYLVKWRSSLDGTDMRPLWHQNFGITKSPTLTVMDYNDSAFQAHRQKSSHWIDGLFDNFLISAIIRGCRTLV